MILGGPIHPKYAGLRVRPAPELDGPGQRRDLLVTVVLTDEEQALAAGIATRVVRVPLSCLLPDSPGGARSDRPLPARIRFV